MSLVVLGCLICLAPGLYLYLSIVHDPTKTKNSNVEPIVEALNVQDDDDVLMYFQNIQRINHETTRINVAKDKAGEEQKQLEAVAKVKREEEWKQLY